MLAAVLQAGGRGMFPGFCFSAHHSERRLLRRCGGAVGIDGAVAATAIPGRCPACAAPDELEGCPENSEEARELAMRW